MAKAFFSRKIPFGVLSVEESNDHISFDAYPVEVDTRVLRLASELRGVLENAQAMFDNMPAPEEAAQTEADYFAAQLVSIFEGYKNG